MISIRRFEAKPTHVSETRIHKDAQTGEYYPSTAIQKVIDTIQTIHTRCPDPSFCGDVQVANGDDAVYNDERDGIQRDENGDFKKAILQMAENGLSVMRIFEVNGEGLIEMVGPRGEVSALLVQFDEGLLDQRSRRGCIARRSQQ